MDEHTHGQNGEQMADPGEAAPGLPQHPRTLRVNSICSDTLQRLRKPCEARGGHGVIALVVGLGIVSLVIFIIYTALRMVWARLAG